MIHHPKLGKELAPCPKRATTQCFLLLAEARKLQLKEGDEMRFRFNVMVNGFVLVSVAVQSATAEALAHVDILNTQGEKIDEADIASTDQGFKVALRVVNLSAHDGGHNSGNPHLHLGDLSSLVVGNNGIGILSLVADSSIFHERGASLPGHTKPDNLMPDSPGNCNDRIVR
jgi:Cu/Zn superoxide dismutase